MRKLLAVAAVCAALSAASNARGTIYTITVPGTITTASGTGPVSVGDTITLTTTVDDSYVVTWGATGFMVAASHQQIGATRTALPLSGALNWRLNLNGIVSDSADYLRDFTPWFVIGSQFDPTLALSGTAIVFNSTGVFGVNELQLRDVNLSPPINYSDVGGAMRMQPFFPPATPGNFGALPLSTAFNAQFLLASDERISGIWNLSAATVSIIPGPIPEPSTWAMMIVGMGLVGGAMRARRKQTLAAA